MSKIHDISMAAYTSTSLKISGHAKQNSNAESFMGGGGGLLI
jgi:hypothetical protein